jgi:hypothetical protein
MKIANSNHFPSHVDFTGRGQDNANIEEQLGMTETAYGIFSD